MQFFLTTGLLTLPMFNNKTRTINLVPNTFRVYLEYQKKYKNYYVDNKVERSYFPLIKGLYYSRIWVLKLSNYIIISIFFYKLLKINTKFDYTKVLRLHYFYKSFLVLYKQKQKRYSKELYLK